MDEKRYTAYGLKRYTAWVRLINIFLMDAHKSSSFTFKHYLLNTACTFTKSYIYLKIENLFSMTTVRNKTQILQ